jgi:chorismate mutase/prephenate dehydratase
LAENDINMTRIESRPSRRKKWHYVFFIDIEGHADDANVAAALQTLEKGTQLFRVLGSYPKAIL